MMTEKSEAVLAHLHAVYPDAKCTLDFRSAFECLVAISLSAQTTDESVNKATPALFRDFPTPAKMAEAPIPSIEKDIQSLGLYHNKAKLLYVNDAESTEIYTLSLPVALPISLII